MASVADLMAAAEKADTVYGRAVVSAAQARADYELRFYKALAGCPVKSLGGRKEYAETEAQDEHAAFLLAEADPRPGHPGPPSGRSEPAEVRRQARWRGGLVNRSKTKGTAWESAVVQYFNDHGFPHAERRAPQGALDKGDIAGIPGVVIECKAVKEITLAAFMDEAERETANAGARLGVAVIKRRQKPTADGYVVMTLAAFVDLVRS
jgi:hypothetical protein